MDVNHIIVLAGLVLVVLLYWTAGRGKKKNTPRTTAGMRRKMLEEIARNNAEEVMRKEDIRVLYTPDALIDAGHEVMKKPSK